MKKTLFIGAALMLVSCSTDRGAVREYGIGVRNDGLLDTRAINVKIAEREYSYGGVSPGNFALHVGGLFLEEGKVYPPIEFEYGLMKEYPTERSMIIEWDGIPKPKGFTPPGEYPALMIVIYPGVEGKKPKVVWRD